MGSGSDSVAFQYIEFQKAGDNDLADIPRNGSAPCVLAKTTPKPVLSYPWTVPPEAET